MIADKIHDEFDNAMAASDSLHRHLRNEFESGRMLRLLVKMGFINERPEYNRAPQWSETGDRYVLKLFRDYVFHQVLSDGAPVLDAGKKLQELNESWQRKSELVMKQILKIPDFDIPSSGTPRISLIHHVPLSSLHSLPRTCGDIIK